jgi:hypothetical protein
MRSPRHALAHAGHLGWALALGAPLVLACMPTPRGTLSIDGQVAELRALETHFVLRIDAASLAHADSLVLSAGADDGVDAIVLLPDDPAHGGSSFARDDGAFRVQAHASLLAALDSACDADGICEIGMTVLVEPSPDAGTPEPSEVGLSVRAATAPEGEFPDSARLELEVDGELPVLATRSSS